MTELHQQPPWWAAKITQFRSRPMTLDAIRQRAEHVRKLASAAEALAIEGGALGILAKSALDVPVLLEALDAARAGKPEGSQA